MLGELFDPQAELGITEHFRPHWSQAGAIVFVTFRTADSIPAEVLKSWDAEKQDWLKRNQLPHGRHWSKILPTLSPAMRGKFKQDFNRCREHFLDSCQGECVLQRPALASIVADSLLYFDGQHYRMGDFIVMPNHVHLMASFGSADLLSKQCDSWLHFTAWQINKALGRSGKFWQQEPFDHLVRSLDQYEYLRRYIADNGVKAKLQPDQYLYRRYEG